MADEAPFGPLEHADQTLARVGSARHVLPAADVVLDKADDSFYHTHTTAGAAEEITGLVAGATYRITAIDADAYVGDDAARAQAKSNVILQGQSALVKLDGVQTALHIDMSADGGHCGGNKVWPIA